MIDFAKELNPEQLAAATSGDGATLVLAAAGTGKTRTLVHRVAYLIEKGVPPWRILLLTFTNRAAREMLERATALLGGGVDGIWSGTFHSIAARLLRRHGVALGLKPGFQIVDEEDQKKLLAEAIKDAVTPGDAKDLPKKEVILGYISQAANTMRPFADYIKPMQSKIAVDVKNLCAVADAYEKRKRDAGVLDFDDLLVYALRLMKECPQIREILQEHFQYVLVDEYQDTNAIQAEFTDLIAAKHKNIMVVGDDFQCIYTWRGAQFDNIMHFPDRWPGCKIVKLERNYRSLAPILDVANSVMRGVVHAFDKTLRPVRKGDERKPRVYRMFDGRQQSEVVVQLMKALNRQGVKWSDIAVVYRSHFTSIDIQMALTRAQVPYRITSGPGVFELVHVKDTLAFLRLLVDPLAELSFLRLLQLLPGVGEAGARKCWVKIGKSFNPRLKADREKVMNAIPAKAGPMFSKMESAFEAATIHIAERDEAACVKDWQVHFYDAHIRAEYEPEDAESRLSDLNEITLQIAGAAEGLSGFLAEVALMTNLDARGRQDLASDHAHLTTVHQAKGMEWPVVIIPWVTDKIFPAARSVEEGNIAEERRLFYVAVTRARNLLYMCCPRARRTPEGGYMPCEDSPFLNDIPWQQLEEKAFSSPPPPKPEFNRYRGDSSGGWGRGGGSSSRSKTTWRR